MSGITGGTARMVMRMATPASQRRNMGLMRRPVERPSRLAAKFMEGKPGVARHGAPARGLAQEKPRAYGITGPAGRLRATGNKARTRLLESCYVGPRGGRTNTSHDLRLRGL